MSTTATTDRLLVLPPADRRAGTPYARAHEGPAGAVAQHGGTVVENADASPAGDGTATALVLVHPVPVEQVEQALAANPDVTWVQLPFAGIEPYVPLIRSRPDVAWTSAKGTYARPVAEHALLLTLALLRDLPGRLRATGWGTPGGRTLDGMECVVVGGGGIAREYVRLLRSWDTRVTAVRRRAGDVPGADRTVTQDRLDEVLPGAGVVMLAAASTDLTRGMIGARQLELMSPEAVLVNVARGTLVDTGALVDALAAGSIHGAGLDVTEPEPLPDGHPLWSEPRCIVTPHTADTPEMCIPLLDARIRRNLAARAGGGELEGLVDVEGGY
ncbi:hydroxyacid dehydrogenase [Citricoccus sp. SGAir0253]|uniref:NAD(P)-dependent oxidoreductase n=1 Tax=Citricoccus sp. SGAir0253 TaxID=2567881 RepID=UPI0010CD34E1|nr:NAD(P)-dependent oxidoreductase [Citricoccus sp. SGAir0253]QCU78719.1 hydroxyacid dehydrogenase [Citricoccus sp. SGAir0253]